MDFGLIQQLPKLLESAGINMSSIMGILKGQSKPTDIAKAVKPFVVKLTPAIDDALLHLETTTGEEVVAVFHLAQLDTGKRSTAVTFCTFDTDGRLLEKDKAALGDLPDYVVKKIEEVEKAKTSEKALQ